MNSTPVRNQRNPGERDPHGLLTCGKIPSQSLLLTMSYIFQGKHARGQEKHISRLEECLSATILPFLGAL